jgi:hypothetical protein
MFKIQLVDFAGRETDAPTVGPYVLLSGIDIGSSLAQKEIEILKFLKSLGGQWEMKSINGVIQLEHILFRENAIDYCVSLHWKGRVQIYKPPKRPQASQKKRKTYQLEHILHRG